MKKARGAEPRTKKNIETDIMGDKTGRIHLGRQDLDTLQTRKMKGLKRGRDLEDDEDMMGAEDDLEPSDIDMEDLTAVAAGSDEDEPLTPKRQRTQGPA